MSYIQPVSKPILPGNLTFKQFLQSVFAGVSGIPGNLVRPRWQPNPPKQPDIDVNWLAIGVPINSKPDANPYIGASPGQQAQGSVTFSYNPTAGNTITVNGVVFTFVSGGVIGNQILIGAKPSDTASNLQQALFNSTDPLLTVATYAYFAEGVVITFKTVGGVGNAFTLAASTTVLCLSGSTLSGGGESDNTMQRHEELEIPCAFYGPNAEENSAILRDGFQIEQNLMALQLANMGFVGTNPAVHVPDLVNERWIDRFEMSVFLRREIIRAYPILAFTSVTGSIVTDVPNLKTVDFNTNV